MFTRKRRNETGTGRSKAMGSGKGCLEFLLEIPSKVFTLKKDVVKISVNGKKYGKNDDSGNSLFSLG